MNSRMRREDDESCMGGRISMQVFAMDGLLLLQALKSSYHFLVAGALPLPARVFYPLSHSSRFSCLILKSLLFFPPPPSSQPMPAVAQFALAAGATLAAATRILLVAKAYPRLITDPAAAVWDLGLIGGVFVTQYIWLQAREAVRRIVEGRQPDLYPAVSWPVQLGLCLLMLFRTSCLPAYAVCWGAFCYTLCSSCLVPRW